MRGRCCTSEIRQDETAQWKRDASARSWQRRKREQVDLPERSIKLSPFHGAHITLVGTSRSLASQDTGSFASVLEVTPSASSTEVSWLHARTRIQGTAPRCTSFIIAGRSTFSSVWFLPKATSHEEQLLQAALCAPPKVHAFWRQITETMMSFLSVNDIHEVVFGKIRPRRVASAAHPGRTQACKVARHLGPQELRGQVVPLRDLRAVVGAFSLKIWDCAQFGWALISK